MGQYILSVSVPLYIHVYSAGVVHLEALELLSKEYAAKVIATFSS